MPAKLCPHALSEETGNTNTFHSALNRRDRFVFWIGGVSCPQTKISSLDKAIWF